LFFGADDASFDPAHDDVAECGEEDGAAGGVELVGVDRLRGGVAEVVGDQADEPPEDARAGEALIATMGCRRGVP
jgi:hypothetical protein